MKRVIPTVILLIFLSVSLQPVQAGWGDFFDEDGNVLPGVLDFGEQRVPVDWMPDVPEWVPDWIYDGSATYHMYTLPNGETVLQPSATTLFFMAISPYESGLLNSDGSVGLGLGYQIWSGGSVAGGNLNGQEIIAATLEALHIPHTDELADAIINHQDAWSMIWEGDARNIFSILWDAIQTDSNVYTMLLLYGNCQNSPTGCPQALIEEMQRLGNCPPDLCPILPPGENKKCAAPTVVQGKITASAVKTAPNYALVTGQDPEKRGVDLQFTLTIEPTIYQYHTLEERTEISKRCVDPNGNLVELPPPVEDNCKAPNRYVEEEIDVEYCVQHTQTFCEQARVLASASLKGSSRDWILNDLALWYPGASLIHPDWNWRNGASQGCDATNTFSWTLTEEQVQIRDPGFYSLSLSGVTSGTPVSPSRSFQLPAGEFDAYLMMTTIIK